MRQHSISRSAFFTESVISTPILFQDLLLHEYHKTDKTLHLYYTTPPLRCKAFIDIMFFIELTAGFPKSGDANSSDLNNHYFFKIIYIKAKISLEKKGDFRI